MLGFILSKMNLLILVVAIFAIVAFFTFGLADIIKIKESELVLDRVTKKAYALVNSPSYCDSAYHYLPRAITVTGEDFYYVMKISKGTIELAGGEDTNILIFSVFSRKDQTNALAANSFRTKAAIWIFSKDYDGKEYSGSIENVCDSPDEGCSAVLDPQARGKQDALVLVKEVIGGLPILYVIPCNSEGNICEAVKEEVGCLVRGYSHDELDQCERDGAGFNC